MKHITIAALCALALSGCTTYHVKRADGTEVRISSMREFPGGLEVKYESAEGAKFEARAGEVRNQDVGAALVPVVVELLKAKAVTPP